MINYSHEKNFFWNIFFSFKGGHGKSITVVPGFFSVA